MCILVEQHLHRSDYLRILRYSLYGHPVTYITVHDNFIPLLAKRLPEIDDRDAWTNLERELGQVSNE